MSVYVRVCVLYDSVSTSLCSVSCVCGYVWCACVCGVHYVCVRTAFRVHTQTHTDT